MYATWVAITDRPVSVITIENRRKMAPRAVGEMTIRPARWAMPWAKNTPTARARKLIRRAVTWIARKSPRGNAPMRKKPPKNPTKRIVDSMAETIRLEANFAIVMTLMSTRYRIIERIVVSCAWRWWKCAMGWG